ncbi:MFS transporter [Aliiglaciecola sp. 2_MG-2023]|uniref:AmpG family muropeptide MFS transporter n=1 Tax=unclassified Aliiglaciecola TaxID=2593648 RepID=UPI0026E2EC0D|nr:MULTISPECIES: MFS transporter [unclassified Aliiglaciecola]MDO6711352.1 MFS transporter [Aliiglaciecola sp. 2_MG-2023]MDO6752199.1 MFS transporter [Aliiglaciecola sp. 1_MG-2023]
MSETLKNTLLCYKDKRLLFVFLFGIASGFPWVMIGSALSAWLQESGLSRSSIGLIGSITIAYSINFLWSPLLDRVQPPVLGQRRGWIVTTQLMIIIACVGMAVVPAEENLLVIGLVGFSIAIFSATQDIAIDAYRIDIIKPYEKDKLAAASSMATAGWWTGYGGLGSIPFFIADMAGWQWSDIYFVLAAIMAGLMLLVFFSDEPVTSRLEQQVAASARYAKAMVGDLQLNRSQRVTNWLMVTLIEPFRDFFSRNTVKLALSILAFIFLFKIGEAFLGRMSIVFYKELGFTNSDIGSYSKIFNWWVTIVFAVLGGMVNVRYGIYRGLMTGGIAMAASNLMFALMSVVGPDKALFAATIFVDGFTAAWSSVALVAFISLLCNQAFSASQYALMASLGTLSRTLMASASGFLVDWMDGNWAFFFILTAVMVLPSLVILWMIKDHIYALEKRDLR